MLLIENLFDFSCRNDISNVAKTYTILTIL